MNTFSNWNGFVAVVILAICIQGTLAAHNKRFIESDQRAASTSMPLFDTAPFQWTQWSAWTHCDATCDVTGSHTRTRQCEDTDNDGEMSDIINCMGSGSGGDDRRRRKRGSTKLKQIETKPCNATGCPVNGGWSNWSHWSDCSTTSGSGFQSRVRACDNPSPQHGGPTCLGDSHQTIACHVNEWSIWGAWTHCDVTCGTGQRSRSRTCQTGNDCTGTNTGTSSCEMPSCTVDGSWGAWTVYSTCSQSCGDGVSVRTRRCDNPAPGNAGAPCNGIAHEFVICNEGPCPIDGGWSNWTTSTCSVTCGQGVQAHFRNCNNPTLQHGGQSCVGDHLKFNHCGAPCPVDGVWSTWTKWTTCSVTSGSGLRMRMRMCANPAPKNGGVACPGSSNETALCTVNMWTNWSSYGACSESCGSGSQMRTRLCMTGDDCVGQTTDTITCENTCAIDGSWSPWSILTECSVTCGKGTQSRTRLCDSPAPQHGGNSCSGNDTEIVDCDRTVCHIDGGWSNYTSQPCSVTCGDGVNIAIRYCNNPSPAYGGQDCKGLSHKFEHCNIRPCPSVTAEQDGGWSAWSEYGLCSSMCGSGHHTRVRTCTDPAPAGGGHVCVGPSLDRALCDNGPCPDNIHICDSKLVQYAIQTQQAILPLQKPPCSNMEFISQQMMLVDLCSAPSDYSNWVLGEDVKVKCSSLPLYIPIASVNHTSHARHYGILTDCNEGILKMATDQCDIGVYEVTVNLAHVDNNMYTVTW